MQECIVVNYVLIFTDIVFSEANDKPQHTHTQTVKTENIFNMIQEQNYNVIDEGMKLLPDIKSQ